MTNTLEAMPRFLSTLVPAGLMGLLVAAMLAADMSTDSSYMLTWGGVIYNDIMAPFRKTKWSEKKGLFWNRTTLAVIGVFLLLYGLWYPLKGDLWTYLTITGTIYLASISTLLIACCYWKRANSWGAAASIIVSALIPASYLVLEQLPSAAKIVPYYHGREALLLMFIDFLQTNPHAPYYSGIAAYLLSGLAMVVGSLMKPDNAAHKETAS
jgi:SSS family solute:Na+ symporter